MQYSRPLDNRIRSVLKDLIEHHSSSRSVAEQMGQAHNYVARVLRGETKLRLDVLERILETLGISESFFLKLVIADGKVENAVEVLRFYGADGPPPGPFIRDTAILVEKLAQAPRVEFKEDPSYPGFSDLLAELEERRHTEKDAVRAELESLICGWAKDALDRPASKQRFMDLAEALCIWGTTQRFEGLRRDASLAFQLSLSLAAAGDCHRVFGLALQKACVLLRDLGCGQAGLTLLEQATASYLRAGDVLACARIFVDRGVLLMGLTSYDAAIDDFETALRLLPETETRHLAASYSNLATCHEQTGRLEAARACLLKAQEHYGDREDAGMAHLLWNRGNIALASNDPAEAEQVLVRSLNLLEVHGKPLEFAFVALSLAEAYVMQKKVESMRRLADRMLAWLPALRGNRVADAALMEWIRCAKWGEVTHRALREAKQKISQTASK